MSPAPPTPAAFTDRLRQMLAQGQDNALLRFSLGKACVEAEQPEEALTHLQAALAHDPNYSVAWKWLGKAHEVNGDWAAAAEAWRQGITVAEQRGDQQALKEMTVFVRRAEKRLAAPT